MQHIVDEEGLSEHFVIDSAGTAGYHIGDEPDSRMQAHARRHGYTMCHHARQLRSHDFDDFDMIITMDDSNFDNARRIAPSVDAENKVHRMTDFCLRHVVDAVPDPYYGGASGFENVIDILEDACRGLLEHLQKKA